MKLTEEEIFDVLVESTEDVPVVRLPPGWLKFAQAIEAKVHAKIKEQGAQGDA